MTPPCPLSSCLENNKNSATIEALGVWLRTKRVPSVWEVSITNHKSGESRFGRGYSPDSRKASGEQEVETVPDFDLVEREVRPLALHLSRVSTSPPSA